MNSFFFRISLACTRGKPIYRTISASFSILPVVTILSFKSIYSYLFECMSLVVDTSCVARHIGVQAAPHLLLSRMFAFDKITLGSSVDKVHSLFFFECLSSINHSITLVLGTSVYSGLLYTHLTFSNV